MGVKQRIQKPAGEPIKGLKLAAAVFICFLAAACGPDPFFVPVMSIDAVPETGTAGVPLTLTGTVNPSFASNTSITWSVEDAGVTGAVLSGKTLTTLTEGEVKIKAKVANGKADGRDFTHIFAIIFVKGAPEYTVSFETNGGSAVGSQRVREEQKASRPVDPVKDGFVFDNWYIDPELTVIYDFGTPVTKDITLYAKWIEQAENTQTPVASDYTFDNLSQSAGSVTAVTITPKGGKSPGTITIYYNGSTTIPQTAGTYTVTFDVAAAPGWNAASGLSAGTLTVSAVYTGTKYTITNTAQWNAAITAIRAAPNADYILDIADPGTGIGIAGATANTSGTTTAGNTLSVALTGTGRLYLTGQGNMLRVAANQTLTIDSPNLTLEGLTAGQNGAVQDNNQSVVYVTGIGGELKIKNGKITGNTVSGIVSGTVYLISSGTFTMSGGEISGNTSSGHGGGVHGGSGTFTMSGGKSSGNTSSGSGGGVLVGTGSNTFTMSGGTISGNTAGSSGGGVYSQSNATFTMSGGKISGNTAGTFGGGVIAETFTMSGGEISGNTASSTNGGGVYISAGSGVAFYMVAGTIYGVNEPNAALRNTANTGAALFKFSSASAEYGTFSGTTWVSNGSLSTTNNTIKVVNGVLQP
jgi:uncharacterized repeat protein (TIGR02543 family)